MANELAKSKISTYGLTMVVIGGCIGSGIFLSPQYAASNFQDPLYLYIAWIIGGFIAVSGALTYGELAGMFPKAGGIYIYLKEAFGKRIAFLYGWSVLTAITSGAIAALAIAFGDNLGGVFGVEFTDSSKTFLALGVVAFNTIVHVAGIKIGEIFINILTGLKILGVIAVILIGLTFVVEVDTTIPEIVAETPTSVSKNIWLAIGLAMMPIMWSFSGFQHASFLADDTKKPKRSVPRAMLIGTAIVATLYLLCNIGYVNLLGLDGLSESRQPAVDGVTQVFSNGGRWMSLLIATSVFGSAFIYTMSAPRIYFAMAKDGVFVKALARKTKSGGTPAVAIITQSMISVFLIFFFGTFENLIEYCTFIEFIFLFLAAAAVFVFRVKRKDAERPIKTPLYPILPILFCVIVTGFLIVFASSNGPNTFFSFVVIVLGVLFYECYQWFTRK